MLYTLDVNFSTVEEKDFFMVRLTHIRQCLILYARPPVDNQELMMSVLFDKSGDGGYTRRPLLDVRKLRVQVTRKHKSSTHTRHGRTKASSIINKALCRGLCSRKDVP